MACTVPLKKDRRYCCALSLAKDAREAFMRERSLVAYPVQDVSINRLDRVYIKAQGYAVPPQHFNRLLYSRTIGNNQPLHETGQLFSLAPHSRSTKVPKAQQLGSKKLF